MNKLFYCNMLELLSSNLSTYSQWISRFSVHNFALTFIKNTNVYKLQFIPKLSTAKTHCGLFSILCFFNILGLWITSYLHIHSPYYYYYLFY